MKEHEEARKGAAGTDQAAIVVGKALFCLCFGFVFRYLWQLWHLLFAWCLIGQAVVPFALCHRFCWDMLSNIQLGHLFSLAVAQPSMCGCFGGGVAADGLAAQHRQPRLAFGHVQVLRTPLA